jgi:hypothetical protein
MQKYDKKPLGQPKAYHPTHAIYGCILIILEKAFFFVLALEEHFVESKNLYKSTFLSLWQHKLLL